MSDVHIRLPLIDVEIGSDDFKKLLNKVKLDGDNSSDIEQMKNIENALGRYVKYTKDNETDVKISKLRDFYFPSYEIIEQEIKNFLNFSNNKQCQDVPLFLLNLFKNINGKNSGENIEFEKIAAWANLLYELGLFDLENTNWSINSNYPEKIKIFYEKESKNDCICYYSNIKYDDEMSLLDKIYTNLIKFSDQKNFKNRKINLIFIDDSEGFGENHGITSEKIKKKKEKEKMREFNNKDNNISWIYPGRPCKFDENNEDDNLFKRLDNKISTEEKHLNIIVIDFIYKKYFKTKDKIYNTILGDDIIRKLREKYNHKNIFTIGYTGGESPFIVNSADKMGADIVLFKNRGGGKKNKSGHNAVGNSAGFFDLLWAISWNVSVWKTFEILKEKKIK